jgi:hypothetical protein
MRLPNAKATCLTSLIMFFVSTLSWLALNGLRVHLYLDAMEGRRGDSAYWNVIRFQQYAVWPMRAFFALFLIFAAYELVRRAILSNVNSSE